MSQEERAKNIRNFTNKTSGVYVLLLTSKIGSVSLNLQCAVLVIVVDMVNAFYLLIQILGRVERIGQIKEAEIYVLWNDLTYDQMAWHRIFKKIVPSLSGEGDAANVKETELHAIEQVKEFFGLESCYNPAHEAWSELPFEKKDEIITHDEMAEWLADRAAAGVAKKKSRRRNIETPVKSQRNVPGVCIVTQF